MTDPRTAGGRLTIMRCSALIFALVTACGGNVERDPGAGGGSAGATGTSFPSDPLGVCQPGFSHYANPALPCPWLADGLCYADKQAACACVCPKDHDSFCMSDFPDPGGAPVAVFCD